MPVGRNPLGSNGGMTCQWHENRAQPGQAAPNRVAAPPAKDKPRAGMAVVPSWKSCSGLSLVR